MAVAGRADPARRRTPVHAARPPHRPHARRHSSCGAAGCSSPGVAFSLGSGHHPSVLHGRARTRDRCARRHGRGRAVATPRQRHRATVHGCGRARHRVVVDRAPRPRVGLVSVAPTGDRHRRRRRHRSRSSRGGLRGAVRRSRSRSARPSSCSRVPAHGRSRPPPSRTRVRSRRPGRGSRPAPPRSAAERRCRCPPAGFPTAPPGGLGNRTNQFPGSNGGRGRALPNPGGPTQPFGPGTGRRGASRHATALAGSGGTPGGLLDASSPSDELKVLLQENADDYRWVAATVGANSAAGYQLAADEPVMAIGGFNGTDPTPTLAQFEEYVANGDIHYFVGGRTIGGAGGSLEPDRGVGADALRRDHARRRAHLRPHDAAVTRARTIPRQYIAAREQHRRRDLRAHRDGHARPTTCERGRQRDLRRVARCVRVLQ